jgi:hypothetical protein
MITKAKGICEFLCYSKIKKGIKFNIIRPDELVAMVTATGLS